MRKNEKERKKMNRDRVRHACLPAREWRLKFKIWEIMTNRQINGPTSTSHPTDRPPNQPTHGHEDLFGSNT